MYCRFPTMNDQEMIDEYINEHYIHNETNLHASCDVNLMDYREWIKKIEANKNNGDKLFGKFYTYLVFSEENRLIGMICIRYELNEKMQMIYGNIGYGVRPSERKKGYATEMLKYAINVCKKKGMEKVVLGCYKDNIASSKTIEKWWDKNRGKNVLW